VRTTADTRGLQQGGAWPTPLQADASRCPAAPGQLTGVGTASPAAPRPGPCTRPRTGRFAAARPSPTAAASRALRAPSDRPAAALDPPAAPVGRVTPAASGRQQQAARPRLQRFLRNVRPAARAPRTTERRTPRRNRATSSRQPAGASPVRGDARVPGSSTPGVGRDPGVEAEEDRPVEGAGDWPVRSIKRSLQRRQESPRKRTKREPSPYSCGEGHGRHQGTWSGCPRTLRRRGRGMARRLSWELERPSVAPSLRGSGSRPVYNRQTGSDGWPPGSRRGS
jgi:hypothetical protein